MEPINQEIWMFGCFGCLMTYILNFAPPSSFERAGKYHIILFTLGFLTRCLASP